ncbi:SGNH/GDSL hydrolase family protein [Ruegeria sp.]|uniref:SGNH/GDSL hydrolase family protein n=1 Tax=Ruegeria sp. TaxID=1879320 RepID=UPI003B5CDAD5
MLGQPNFDKIVFFGDSFTDSGIFFGASSSVALFGLPPVQLGYDQQFSNGDVYADIVPGLLSVDAINLAVGDAQALTDRTISDVLADTGLIRPDALPDDLAFRVDFVAQVERFVQDTAGTDLSATAASVLIGVNDFGNFAPTSSLTAVVEGVKFGADTAIATLQSSAVLAASGVGTIIFNTLPSLSVLPTTSGQSPEEQLLSSVLLESYNATLVEGAGLLELLGVDVVIVEFGAMWEEIAADFESFGFKTFADPVLLGQLGSEGPNPAVLGIPHDQIAFYDPVHPTTELHEILAVFQAESLTSHVQVGSAEYECILGSAGDDLVLARAGNDFLDLGAGNDVAIAGLGDDRAIGGTGNDLLAGGSGRDLLCGNSGRDILADGSGDDRVFGGSGSDLLIDGAGSDLAFGGEGDDVFIFTEDNLLGRDADEMDCFYGGSGEDTLIIRVEDAAVELTAFEMCGGTYYEALGLMVYDIENVIVVEGTDTPFVVDFEAELATAELWNFL